MSRGVGRGGWKESEQRSGEEEDGRKVSRGVGKKGEQRSRDTAQKGIRTQPGRMHADEGGKEVPGVTLRNHSQTYREVGKASNCQFKQGNAQTPNIRVEAILFTHNPLRLVRRGSCIYFHIL